MAAVLAWIQAHAQVAVWLSSGITLLIDYVIGKNPTSPANGLLHWIELQIQALVSGLKGS